jgi:hypothetical protein
MTALRELHPLKRKSVKPSISTVRGMLPGKQFRMLDTAMQGLRTAGLRLEWVWKGNADGWVCVGMWDDKSVCELHPVEDPLIGAVLIPPTLLEDIKISDDFPGKYKKILGYPVETNKKATIFEFELADAKHRALFSDFIENLETFFRSGVDA